MEQILHILQQAVEMDASDFFITEGLPLTFKVEGQQRRMQEPALTSEQTLSLVREIYALCKRDPSRLEHENCDDDFSFSAPNLGRFRANVLRQRGTIAVVVRVFRSNFLSAAQLNIPAEVMRLAHCTKGLVLVTGAAGCGKSTTIACVLDAINKRREGHIITIEDPIEYIHKHEKCIVTQREIATDTSSYVGALRSALRESPDVIFLGEMRDRETIEAAVTAAETGQLLFSTLHTPSAASAVDRIVDVFPANQQPQVRMQLSMILQAVVCQQLVPTIDGRQIPVFEVMYANLAVKNLIREGKTHQIDAAIHAGAAQGMMTMDTALLRLVQQNRITPQTAMQYSLHYEAMENRLSALFPGKLA